MFLVGAVTAGGGGGGDGLGGVGRHRAHGRRGPTSPGTEPRSPGRPSGGGEEERGEEWAAEHGRGHSETAVLCVCFPVVFSEGTELNSEPVPVGPTLSLRFQWKPRGTRPLAVFVCFFLIIVARSCCTFSNTIPFSIGLCENRFNKNNPTST